jgi:predicted KAP-like P-loop ATPase
MMDNINSVIERIEKTKKLFRIEGTENGQVNIEASQHLLSLPESQQIKVLNTHLEYLKEGLAKHGDSSDDNDDIIKVQLQLFIQVTENLLSQV